MGFFGYFGKGVSLAMLKGDAAEEVARDEDAFVPALFILLFPSLVIGVLAAVFMRGVLGGMAGGELGGMMARFGLIMPVATVFVSLVWSVVFIGILHLLARLFGGSGGFLDYYQTLGVGSLVLWGSAIPYLGVLFSLWSIPVYVVITARVHDMGTGKAAAVVLIPYLIIALLAIVLISFGVVAGLMAGAPGMESMGGMQ